MLKVRVAYRLFATILQFALRFEFWALVGDC